jgi:hypothetical protein
MNRVRERKKKEREREKRKGRNDEFVLKSSRQHLPMGGLFTVINHGTK